MNDDEDENKFVVKVTGGCAWIGCLGGAAVFILLVLAIIKLLGSYLFG